MDPFKGDVKLYPYKGLNLLYGEPVIFHCNHYNLYLQRTVEDAGNYIDAPRILADGGRVVAYHMLQRLFEARPEIRDSQARLQIARDLYAQLGFGTLPVDDLTVDGGQVVTPITHYSLGWQEKWETRDQPVDYFTCGYLAAALAIAYYQAPGAYQVTQKRCLSMGHETNEFVAERRTDFEGGFHSPGWGVTIQAAQPHPTIPTKVDASGITEAIRGMPLEGNADGLIPAFGVYLTRHFANYYNYITYEAARAIREQTGEPELARELFIEAGHQCAFHTFGGILTSDEWYGLVEPQCETKADWVAGIVAVVNALGWGRWTVKEFEPDKKLVICIDGSYESNGYLAMYGRSSICNSYLVTGGVAGLMNLFYSLDVTQRPDLTESLYNELIDREDLFSGTQVKCRSQGDAYCEVIASRS